VCRSSQPRSINKSVIGWRASKSISPRWTWPISGSGKGRGRRHKQHNAGGSFGTRQLITLRKSGPTRHRKSEYCYAVDVEVGTLADQIAHVNTGMVAPQVTPSVHGIKQAFTRHFYQRLPNLLSHKFKEIPVADGTDVNVLCDLLLKVIKIRQVRQMNDSAIYELMYPYCRGELLALVTHAINTKETFENLHARSLGHLITPRGVTIENSKE